VTNIKFAIVILVVLMLAGVAGASELSDYKYLSAHQDNTRNVAALNDMAFAYGGMANLNARMALIANAPVMTVNAYAKYNPATGNVEWTGVQNYGN
jgi:hypothetical protein